MSLFFLEANVHVHPGKVSEFESLSETLAHDVEQSEPGMLMHVQTKVSENGDEAVYKWSSVYESYEALPIHLQNPPVQAYMQKLGEGILTAPIEIRVYCDWTDEQKNQWRDLPGLNVEYIPCVSGYFR